MIQHVREVVAEVEVEGEEDEVEVMIVEIEVEVTEVEDLAWSVDAPTVAQIETLPQVVTLREVIYVIIVTNQDTLREIVLINL